MAIVLLYFLTPYLVFKLLIATTVIILLFLHREEIVITRARIGHTYFTHSYLLKGDDMPWCIPRHCPDTVKHILLDCIDVIQELKTIEI